MPHCITSPGAFGAVRRRFATLSGVHTPSRRQQLTGAGFVTAGSLVANLAAYFLHLPASRWMGPEGYGELAALLSAQLIVAVPSLALQAVVARETVRGAGPAGLRRLALRSTAAVAVVGAALTVPVAMLLDTQVSATVAALAPGALLCLLAAEQGLLQGRERFGVLAGVLALAGLAKVVPALAVIAFGGTVGQALAAGAAGVAAAWIVARLVVEAQRPGTGGDDSAGADVRTVLAAGQVQLVLIALTSVDLLLARALLSPEDAGRYALGAIAAKAAFWLPQAVGTVLYPRMADPLRHRGAVRAAVAVLTGIGTVVVAGAFVLAPLVPAVVGAEYAPVTGVLWAFATLGVLLSVLQVLLMSTIAVNRTADAAVAWFGLAGVVLVVLLVPREIGALLGATIAVVALTTFAAGLLAGRRH